MRVRVGVVGLGRLWDARHRPALARMKDRFQVTAIYDQVAWRAEAEAEALGCVAVEGLTELVERPDVDALYFLSPQWFGTHAVEMAAAAGRPIYWGLPIAADLSGLEAIAGLVRGRGIPFMPELARRFYPATRRLLELLETSLGPPRLIVGHSRLLNYDRYSTPGPTTQLAPVPLAVDPGGNLIDWCRLLFQSDPLTIAGFGAVVIPSAAMNDDFEGLTMTFPGGGLAHLTFGRYHRAVWSEAVRFLPRPGFKVFTERGAAWVEMPDFIQWTDSSGAHEERLPLDPPVGEILNAEFYRLLSGQPSHAPSLDDALIAARAVRLFQRGREDGRRLMLPKVC